MPSTCIEDDDLEVGRHFRDRNWNSMLAGPNRENVRNWIESLATQTRVIFVLRAVAGFHGGRDRGDAGRTWRQGSRGSGMRMQCGRSSGRGCVHWLRS